MPTYTLNTSSLDSELPAVAGRTLIYLTVALGALSFWAEAFASGEPLGFAVALILTCALWACSTVLSGAVERFTAARERAPATAAMAVALTVCLILLEAGMTHHGLVWTDARYELAPNWVLVIAAFCLSVLNAFCLFTFARDLPKRSVEAARAHDDILGQPGDYSMHDDRMKAWESRMSKDPEKARDPKISDLMEAVREKMGG